jgi:hypothetical protein
MGSVELRIHGSFNYLPSQMQLPMVMLIRFLHGQTAWQAQAVLHGDICLRDHRDPS